MRVEEATAAAADLSGRFGRMSRFVAAARPHLPAERLAGAVSLVDRASARLRLSPDHTVAAFTGPTGGGKSSLFNAIAGIPLSPVSRRRPTTDEVHACVWRPAGSGPLLDWLGVPEEHRFSRESALDAEDEAGLRGLVLLDLPDVDSIVDGHRVESLRLLGLVDLLIWVVDPQKYADRYVHQRFLREMRPLREVTVVVLNQIDRLSRADAFRCMTDLAQLLADDGLPGVTVRAASALTGEGVGDLRHLLEQAVASRTVWQDRLAGELEPVLADVLPLAGDEVPPDAIGEAEVVALGEAVADSGFPGAAATRARRGYARQASLLFRRRRNLSTVDGPEARTESPEQVERAALDLADRAGATLPEPWPEGVRAAAFAPLPGLLGSLERAVRDRPPRRPRRFGWWVVRLLFWLGLLAAVAGAGWWATDWLLRRYDRRGLVMPSWHDRPVVLLVAAAGLALAVLVALLSRPIARRGARKAAYRAEEHYREVAAEVAQDEIVAPVQGVLDDYMAAREALRQVSLQS